MIVIASILLVIVFLFLFYVAWVALHPLPDLSSKTEDEINKILDEEVIKKSRELANE